MSKYCLNRFRTGKAGTYPKLEFSIDDVEKFHRTIPSYSNTPLVSLSGLARKLKIGNLLVKDESHRFGLRAFKGLGASFAIFRLFSKVWHEEYGEILSAERFWSEIPNSGIGPMHFCTATDGNHGRGVAWMARLMNRKATIYMPHDSAAARVKNIEAEGAVVVVVDGDYDLAVTMAAQTATENNWQMISDTSYEGYIDIPFWITCGYFTLFKEVSEQLDQLGIDRIDCCFIPGGVGALAAAAALYYRTIAKDENVKLICVEPDSAACLLESAHDADGALRVSQGAQNSIMAGLNCATPSVVAWPIIRDAFDLFISIPDSYAERAMRALYDPIGSDSRITSGESGAASLAGLLALLSNASFSGAITAINLSQKANVLVISTEGDTDPDSFRRIVK